MRSVRSAAVPLGAGRRYSSSFFTNTPATKKKKNMPLRAHYERQRPLGTHHRPGARGAFEWCASQAHAERSNSARAWRTRSDRMGREPGARGAFVVTQSPTGQEGGILLLSLRTRRRQRRKRICPYGHTTNARGIIPLLILTSFPSVPMCLCGNLPHAHIA